MILNPAVMQAQAAAAVQNQLTVQRALSVSTLQSPMNGGHNFFDRCADGMMSLHFSGALPLLDWMGFEVTDEYYQALEFLTFVRPEQSGGNPTAGAISDPCAEPNGIEYGKTKLSIEDFGRYGRKSPVRDIMVATTRCSTDPRARLDGTLINNEDEWDLRFATDVIIQDVQRDLVEGNATNSGEFDGLERLVASTYDSSMLNSIMVDWNNAALDSSASSTYNGTAFTDGTDFVQLLREIVRRIRQRVSWSPSLRNQRMNLGDAILVLPSDAIGPLLDFFTCWSVCTSDNSRTVNINSPEAVAFRNSLNGGMFGWGQIEIDGIPIPLMAFDSGLIKGPTTFDAYFLMGRLGSVPFWRGQHLSATQAAAAHTVHGYGSVDGGRLLTKADTENECRVLKAWMHPRIWCRAPWAQARISNIKYSGLTGWVSGDPNATSYYPLSSFGGDLATVS